MSADADCLFCKIVAGDIPADVVAQTDDAVAFRDVNPQAPTHALVVPRSHFADAAALADGEPDTLASLVRLARDVATRRWSGRLPPRVQHRPRRGSDCLPHPPARARRKGDDMATRLTAMTAASSSPPRWPAAAPPTRPTTPTACPSAPSPRRRASPRPRRPTAPATPRPTSRRPAATAMRAARPSPSRCAQGEKRMTLRDARRLHALGPQRHRHRRLPLLPARPSPHQGRVPDRHVRQAGQRRRRPPRHLVHRAARPGGRGRGDGRRRARRGLDLLRRLRAARQRRAQQRAVARRLGTGRQGVGELAGVRQTARGGQPHHHAGPLQPLAGAWPRRLRDAAALRPRARPTSPRSRPCCSRRRSRCRAARSTPTARSATATPRSPT